MVENQLTLKAARVNAGLTQQEVADVFGVTASAVCLWEQNPENVNTGIFKKLCKLYGKPMDAIFVPFD